MPLALPTAENVEEQIQYVEEVIFSTIHTVTADLPNVKYAFQRLQEDLARFWPQSLPPLPEIKMPSLGAFEVPPPPPPLPVPKSAFEKSLDWAGAHPWKAASLGVGIVGVGVLTGYGLMYRMPLGRPRRHRVAATSHDGERRQVVVVLGGDTPLGLPLILNLEAQGYIVITSVCTPDAVREIEPHTHGYVRAIVLDPSEPATIPYFLRSLSSTMSRRFPITASGDPHSAPTSQLYIHSVVSLITLPASHVTPSLGPLENLGMQDAYPAYLQATHFTPLQVIQSLLPLMRNSPRHDKKSIVVCLPAIDGRVGLPFSGAQAMSAAATLRGVEVLRREIRIAAVTEKHESHARSMKNISVVVVDVGNFAALQQQAPRDSDVERATIDWSASEKTTYGAAFANVLAGSTNIGTNVVRRQSDTSRFVKTLADVISHGGKGPLAARSTYLQAILASIHRWIRGDRIAVGAGAWTYTIASKLPSILLDSLLVLPHFILSIHNAILPVPPHVTPLPPPVPAPHPAQAAPQAHQAPAGSAPVSDAEHESDHGSDADVESSGYGSGVGESWISLQPDVAEQPWR
ncbi:hypothetical protein BDW22DRAFT_1421839 [Trametopsis cervina]|nr:hypothetical protein BDW22DRAFT_1421839 [Trametopsis cervina]